MLGMPHFIPSSRPVLESMSTIRASMCTCGVRVSSSRARRVSSSTVAGHVGHDQGVRPIVHLDRTAVREHALDRRADLFGVGVVDPHDRVTRGSSSSAPLCRGLVGQGSSSRRPAAVSTRRIPFSSTKPKPLARRITVRASRQGTSVSATVTVPCTSASADDVAPAEVGDRAQHGADVRVLHVDAHGARVAAVLLAALRLGDACPGRLLGPGPATASSGRRSGASSNTTGGIPAGRSRRTELRLRRAQTASASDDRLLPDEREAVRRTLDANTGVSCTRSSTTRVIGRGSTAY